jgi:nitrogen regulatory protein PII
MVAAPDDAVQRVCTIIERLAHTGRPGDGKIFVLPLEDAVRIATGERLDAALQ